MSVWVYPGFGKQVKFFLFISSLQSVSVLDGDGSSAHPDVFELLYLNFGAHMVYGSGPYFPVVQFLSASDPQPATYTSPFSSWNSFDSGKQIGNTSLLKITSSDSLIRAKSFFGRKS